MYRSIFPLIKIERDWLRFYSQQATKTFYQLLYISLINLSFALTQFCMST